MKTFKWPPILGQVLLLLLAAVCLPASHAQTAPPHPIVGIWTWTLFNGQCTEALQYRADGVLLSTSGDAVTVWRYSVGVAPEAQGFYKLLETSIRYNSKKDCYGDVVDEEGLGVSRFIQLNPAKDRLIVCKSASLAECYGPLKREPSP
jgi:hypothetical protein